VVNYRENLEHPPMVKLMFAAELAATSAPAPDWSAVQVGRPIPPDAEPAFLGTRWLSWAFGMGQLALVGAANPVAALLLSVSTYHAKYSAQAYLESVPALFAILAVLLFERAFRKKEGAPHRGLFFASAVLLGLATAGKYPYGLVTGLGIAPFLPLWMRGKPAWWFGYVGVALLAFFVADPFLWPGPISRLSESIGFHYGFSQSEHVKRSGLPWYQPLYWLTHSEPAKWHKGLFFTSLTDWILLPLSVLGLWHALRTRPVFASWFLIGLAFLFVWPTKWPQYILLILPAVAVCAGLGVEWVVLWARRLWAKRTASAATS
jgi:4-amino-4-deoxy-L-arabinose transferase-like glycosyltransferase